MRVHAKPRRQQLFLGSFVQPFAANGLDKHQVRQVHERGPHENGCREHRARSLALHHAEREFGRSPAWRRSCSKISRLNVRLISASERCFRRSISRSGDEPDSFLLPT